MIAAPRSRTESKAMSQHLGNKTAFSPADLASAKTHSG